MHEDDDEDGNLWFAQVKLFLQDQARAGHKSSPGIGLSFCRKPDQSLHTLHVPRIEVYMLHID